jgi:hypothetical protein
MKLKRYEYYSNTFILVEHFGKSYGLMGILARNHVLMYTSFQNLHEGWPR